MSADKHPAEVLADTEVQTLADHLALDRAWLRDEYGVHIASMLGAERELRRIPAQKAERDRLTASLEKWVDASATDGWIGQMITERDQLRAEVEALREANSTFATAAILPDDKVIVDKAEIEALREDAELYRWILVNYARGDGFTAVDAALNDGMANEQLTPAIKAARKQQ